jgi:hypothetical protein
LPNCPLSPRRPEKNESSGPFKHGNTSNTKKELQPNSLSLVSSSIHKETITLHSEHDCLVNSSSSFAASPWWFNFGPRQPHFYCPLYIRLASLVGHRYYAALNKVHELFVATLSLQPMSNTFVTNFHIHSAALNPAAPLIDFDISLSRWLLNLGIKLDFQILDDRVKIRLYALFTKYRTELINVDCHFLVLVQQLHLLGHLIGTQSLMCKVNALRSIFLRLCHFLEASFLKDIETIVTQMKDTFSDSARDKFMFDNTPLKKWFFTHLPHPYPTPDEKSRFAAQCGISIKQINTWFANMRGRYKRSFFDYLCNQRLRFSESTDDSPQKNDGRDNMFMSQQSKKGTPKFQ